MTKFVSIKTFANRIEADLAKARLEAAGINAFVSADDAGGLRPEVAFATGGARLHVAVADRERAVEALSEDGSLDLASGDDGGARKLGVSRGCRRIALVGVVVLLGFFVSAYALGPPWITLGLVLVATVLFVTAIVMDQRRT